MLNEDRIKTLVSLGYPNGIVDLGDGTHLPWGNDVALYQQALLVLKTTLPFYADRHPDVAKAIEKVVIRCSAIHKEVREYL